MQERMLDSVPGTMIKYFVKWKLMKLILENDYLLNQKNQLSGKPKLPNCSLACSLQPWPHIKIIWRAFTKYQYLSPAPEILI